MSDYGAHPTQYGNLSDGNLYAMYRESVYRSLSESQKLDLLQETVNRDAAARGEVGSPKVRFENLPSRTDGYAEKGIISVHRQITVHGNDAFFSIAVGSGGERNPDGDVSVQNATAYDQ